MEGQKSKIFVASVSPQVRASLAATYGTSEREAGWMIDQLLRGPEGLMTGGRNGFTFVVDTNAMREVALVVGAEEMSDTTKLDAMAPSKQPVLASACPGWVCFAEKNSPHVIPHLSRTKSPQALSGILLKTVLSKCFSISPHRIFHVAIMPCFDKKLEASREELTNLHWEDQMDPPVTQAPVRDVDCVITAREILMLADSRGISFPNLPKKPLDADAIEPFPDCKIARFLFPSNKPWLRDSHQKAEAGSSGGFLFFTLRRQQQLHPGSEIRAQRGRNSDMIEYCVERDNEVIFRAARYYGFRNIQNLVRKLKPAKESRLGRRIGAARQAPAAQADKSKYAYVEVMACPGGCTNGGGQIKTDELGSLQAQLPQPTSQKEWLARVNDAYYSGSESDADVDSGIEIDIGEEDAVEGVSSSKVEKLLKQWETLTGIHREKLLYTSFRQVVSDIGKPKASDTERVAEVAARLGGGW